MKTETTDGNGIRWAVVVAVCMGACSEVPKYRPLADGGGNAFPDAAMQVDSQTDVLGDATADGSDADAVSDATCNCPGAFACVAGACKTTCATSTDCHPDYFCDPSNHRCHSDVISVAVGSSFQCAALLDGRAICWGRNDRGQLGIGATSLDLVEPTPVAGLSGVVLVRADEYNGCALTSTGNVYCWGSGAFSGTGHVDPAPVLIRTASGSDLGTVRLLSVGPQTACAVTDATTYCWGQVTVPATPLPVPVSGGGAPLSIAVGSGFVIGAYGGEDACPWGENGSVVGPRAPTTNVRGQCFATGGVVEELLSGDRFAFARLRTGVVVAWGENALSLLGLGTGLSEVLPPGDIIPGLNAIRMAAGYGTVCAIPSDDRRTIRCWGGPTDRPAPVAIDLPAGVEVKDLGAGSHAYSICAIISDGSLQCMSDAARFEPIAATW